jgi:hypothetical protein
MARGPRVTTASAARIHVRGPRLELVPVTLVSVSVVAAA